MLESGYPTCQQGEAYDFRIPKDDKCTHMPSSKLKRSQTAGQTALHGELDKGQDLVQKLSLRLRR